METDWFVVSRSAVAQISTILREGSAADRARETGTRGEGGDATLVIDERAETVVFDLLQIAHDRGERFTAISEERGRVDFGSEDLFVIVDPIDGSTNAKRGLPHHSLSIAVATGPTMADVKFGYVYDFGTGEEWHAGRAEGAALSMKRLERDVPERRSSDGKLELVGIESADPRWVRDAADGLVDRVHRLRALGTIAVTLCQVAGARLDGMLTLRPARSVDTAAGQLIVREAGGHVCFPGYDDPLGAPLDLDARVPIVAARSDAALQELLAVLS